jgi:dipeptidyl aminopeptidase/acylaminoacyl peptidase
MSGTIPFERFLQVRSSYGATFDASGKRLYFVSTISGVPNLWSLPQGIANASRHFEDVAWPEPLALGPERVQYAFASSRPERLLFGRDRGGDERTELCLLDGIGTRPRVLTRAPEAIHHFGSWHPDGRHICYAANERDERFFDLYVMDVEQPEPRLIYRHDSTNRAIGFEPGTDRLLIQRIHAPFEHELLLVDQRDGSAESLTAGTPPARYEGAQWTPGGQAILCVSDRDGDFLTPLAINPNLGSSRPLGLHQRDTEDVTISPNGRFLAYATNAGGYGPVELWSIGSQAPAALFGTARTLAYDAGRWLPTFGWSPDSRRLAVTMTIATSPLDVYVGSPPDMLSNPPRVGLGEPVCLAVQPVTRSWTSGLTLQDLTQARPVQYPTFDGRQIHAFLFRPSAAPRDASLPAVVWVHGGPESQFRPGFNPVIQYFAHRGFLVLAPNVRGSTGYGKAFSRLDDVERRLDAVRDLAAGAEWLASSGEAHPKQIAVMGASYGGYMVLAALTERPDLWAAGVDIVGIANFVTFLERTGPWRRHLREAEYGSLDRHRDLLERLSPIHRAERITAPLMVVHGANDPRVPVSEAEQIVSTLRDLGRPVEYLRFEDEGHGIVKLDNRLVAYPRIADFLEQHLIRTP